MKKKKGVAIVLFGIAIVLIVVGVILDNRYIPFNHFKTKDCIDKEICKFNKNKIEFKKEVDRLGILINGKKVFEYFPENKMSEDIYTFDELVLFSVTKKGYNHYKVIEIINTVGKETTISQLPLKGMRIQDYVVNGKEVIITGSRFSSENAFWIGGGSDTKIESCDDYVANKDEVVMAKYKMTYLGNNKFSELEEIDRTTLENYSKFKNLCNNDLKEVKK